MMSFLFLTCTKTVFDSRAFTNAMPDVWDGLPHHPTRTYIDIVDPTITDCYGPFATAIHLLTVKIFIIRQGPYDTVCSIYTADDSFVYNSHCCLCPSMYPLNVHCQTNLLDTMSHSVRRIQ